MSLEEFWGSITQPCTSPLNTVDNIDKGYRFREPAPATQEFMKETRKQFKEIGEKVDAVNLALACLPENLIEKLDKKYVSEEAFNPIRKLVYGAVGVVGTLVITALIYLILQK